MVIIAVIVILLFLYYYLLFLIEGNRGVDLANKHEACHKADEPSGHKEDDCEDERVAKVEERRDEPCDGEAGGEVEHRV